MLKTDPTRKADRFRTGYSVATDEGNVDAGWLDAESFLRWLRLRGGYNPWAEKLMMQTLGYTDFPDIGHTVHEKAQAGLGIATEGFYDVSVDIVIRRVTRSQHQAALLLLGFDHHDNVFEYKLP